ncbi:MAG: aminodeoxychorismate synthase component I [Leptospiraceae bacterium]|nr:aminodeoxychorismate synthase component I [Leptospiraceae bacterium]
MNFLTKEKVPFFFAIDYEMQTWDVFPASGHEAGPYRFSFPENPDHRKNLSCAIEPLRFSYTEFHKRFQKIKQKIEEGYSWLANLTFSIPVKLKGDLEDIYLTASSPYRILRKNSFVCFSPESFVKIRNGRIETRPMKGTLSMANDEALEEKLRELLHNAKEKAEQYTVTDLLRNDLSQVAHKVKVESFRYPTVIAAGEKKILQTSTLISGELKENFRHNLGDLFLKILPAGSVTGAPKRETVRLLRKIEKQKRGFYCGVAGFFDGENLDSCVLIRFLEKKGKNFYYHSGVGVTADSVAEDEYQELLDKVYVPFS